MPAGLKEKVAAWQSKGFSNEKIRPPTTLNNIVPSKVKWHKSEIKVEFKESCLKLWKVTFTPRNVAHLFIYCLWIR